MTTPSASSRTSVGALRIAHRHPTERETGASQHEQRSGSEAKPSASSVGSADELSEHLELLGLAEAAIREDESHEERNASEEGGDASEEERVHGVEHTQARMTGPSSKSVQMREERFDLHRQERGADRDLALVGHLDQTGDCRRKLLASR